jgi:hypothetical protein
LIRAKKDLKRKKPTRRDNQVYWNEAQFKQLQSAAPAKLYSKGPMPWRLLAYLLKISPEVARVRTFMRKRLMDEPRLLAAEKTLQVYHDHFGIRAVNLRLTNVYGPRQNLVKDDLGFLPVFIRRALRGEPIEVFGDGSQLRDCLHVSDVVGALLLAANCDEAVGQVFNLGHPEARPVLDIARHLAATAGAGSTVSTTRWPPERLRIDIGSFQGDYSKAKRVLGWEPFVAVLDGLTDTLAFYRDHPWYLPPM